jgi:hypothetical protein
MTTPSQAGLNGGGETTNFSVWYDSNTKNLPNQSVVIANANALLGVVETEFTATTGPDWFNTPLSTKFQNDPSGPVKQRVNLYWAPPSGAQNNGYKTPIIVDSVDNTGDPTVAGQVEALFMAEWSEILMSITNNWNSLDSSGEGLSQFTNILRFQAGHYNFYNSAGRWFFQGWLNGDGKAFSGGKEVTSPNAARSDWVNNTFTSGTYNGVSINGDSDIISFGCALGFIFYLYVQLGIPKNQIISTYKSNLASIYKAVTGDNGDPFPFFLNLISSVYPASSTWTIPSPVRDNPFPIAIVTLGGKSTFGPDEATDIINNQGGLVSGGLWVEVTGFSKNSFNALNVTADNNFSLPGISGFKIGPNSEGPQFQAGVSDYAPQTIMIPFDITLSQPFPKTPPGSYTLTGFLNFTDNFTNPSSPTVTKVTGGSNSMQIEILAGADPYFQNQDVQQNNYPYLSNDLRVFTATLAQTPVPIPGGPTLSDSISGAYQYIQDLLTYLNGSSDFTNPSGSDAFETFPSQYQENQTDSNVTPYSPNIGTFPPTVDNNYNFAVARVRLLGTAGTSNEATDVRVFFRLFTAQTNDTDYDINSTYPSTPDPASNPGSPQVSSNNVTIPMFATGNFPTGAQNDYADGGPNKATIKIPQGQNGVYQYYGCFLNVYDPNYQINGQDIRGLLPSTHNCIVAQIAYDGAPIPQGASPLSWDQLAQRNLTVTPSDNPGPAESHRVPQTFDCRPSGPTVPPGRNTMPVPPDELVIDWGDVPEGSVASIYWPKVNAADVIALATQFYPTNPLSSSDSHTLTLSVSKGLSYIPIPSGAGESFAGLFTIDLPPAQVSTGQTFDILVRRLSSRTYTPERPPRTAHTVGKHGAVQPAEAGEGAEQAPIPAARGDEVVVRDESPYAPFSWRYNVGSFSVKIPVMTGDAFLPAEENTYAIMSWRLQQTAPANRWYPVLQRYVSYIAGRISGLGGDPSAIPPSPTGAPVKVHPRERCYTGKVCEVVYDCHGGFEAFVLEICCDERKVFKSKERGVCDVVFRALVDGLLLTVEVVETTKDGEKICGLKIRPC